MSPTPPPQNRIPANTPPRFPAFTALQNSPTPNNPHHLALSIKRKTWSTRCTMKLGGEGFDLHLRLLAERPFLFNKENSNGLRKKASNEPGYAHPRAQRPQSFRSALPRRKNRLQPQQSETRLDRHSGRH